MKGLFKVTNSVLLGMIVAIGAIASPMIAEAGTVRFKSSAAGICQAALPSGAGSVIRARPLAVQNEGTNAAFVTCSLPYDSDEAQPQSIAIMLTNSNSVDSHFSCTLVSGTTPADTNYVVKSVNMFAGSTRHVVFYYSFDLPNSPSSIPGPNLSCALPPGVGIVLVYYY